MNSTQTLRRWTPSAAGRELTQSPDWSITLLDETFELVVNMRPLSGSSLLLEQMQVVPGVVWSQLKFPAKGGHALLLDGLPNAQGRELRKQVTESIARLRHRQKVTELAKNFPSTIHPILQWGHRTTKEVKRRLQTRGWLGARFVDQLVCARPRSLDSWIKDRDVRDLVLTQPQSVKDAIDLYGKDLVEWCLEVNNRYKVTRQKEESAFFEQVEKSPLTQEQIDAVTCFEDRVLLVAAAGSGKTSTMVAKAAYAVKSGYFEPDRILMLAFNSDAAAELRQRILDRLTPLGLPASRISAHTFHAFGLDVIGKATGKRPTVAPWVESGRDLETLLELVDDLKDRDPVFRTRWDLFRVVLGQDLPAFGKEKEAPESWNREKGEAGFWTLNNEVVKSRGEQLIANWLFYNGVHYEYERAYEHDTADAQRRQYRPDFYIVEAQAYLEHWAVDDKGEPPTEFVGYKQGMEWKRQVHARYGTRLLETTMAELWSGKAFTKLEKALGELGISLDPNPNRPAPGRSPIENNRLARNFRMFLTHVKNNRLDMATLRQRLSAGSAGRFAFRHQMFLDLFDPIHQAWEKRLQSGGFIDFEDMLNLAADHLEQGRWQTSYELVMVDEFQDASHARARLVKALTAKPDACLFAVGDDWQSINRFAGADLGVMTRFEEIFGHATTLKLETTFRCPQSLCDISSQFAQKNPAQLRKKVKSTKPAVIDPVQIVKVDSDREVLTAVRHQIQTIGAAAAERGERHKVLLLGRYRKDRDYLPAGHIHTHVEVEFMTAHGSKGLECDHVIVPRMTSEVMGFPSRIEDDPVMSLAMPTGDNFEFSEERRLFYVAMTRAKRTVRLITVDKKESSFVIELIKNHQLSVVNLAGNVRQDELCPVCHRGFVVEKKSRYGPFHACNKFPACNFKRSIKRV